MRSVTASSILCLVLVAAVGCARLPSGDPVQVRFARAPVTTDVDPWVNWHHRPITTFEDFQDLDGAYIEVLEMKGAGAGTTGARKVVLHLPKRDDKYQVKVKLVPEDLDGWNNSPRKEIATYKLQWVFLEPEDYVVPTSNLYCVPTKQWEKHAEPQAPTIPGTDCILVNLSFWLDDVTVPEPVYDRERFLDDPNYAYHLANLNILTYLADHHDQRSGNILASVHEKDRHVYAIDNGITFGPPVYNWFVPSSFQWSRMLVPALPKQKVERLRALKRSDLDYLATVTQMKPDASGRLQLVRPEPPWNPKRGGRRRGSEVQFGLTEGEIDDLWVRIEKLVEAVDEGRLTLF
jgi:hypothetical protein